MLFTRTYTATPRVLRAAAQPVPPAVITVVEATHFTALTPVTCYLHEDYRRAHTHAHAQRDTVRTVRHTQLARSMKHDPMSRKPHYDLSPSPAVTVCNIHRGARAQYECDMKGPVWTVHDDSRGSRARGSPSFCAPSRRPRGMSRPMCTAQHTTTSQRPPQYLQRTPHLSSVREKGTATSHTGPRLPTPSTDAPLLTSCPSLHCPASASWA